MPPSGGGNGIIREGNCGGGDLGLVAFGFVGLSITLIERVERLFVKVWWEAAVADAERKVLLGGG